MNNKITDFLDKVCIHIKCKSVHKEIRYELYEHISDLIDEYKNDGLDEDTAIEKAIVQMGSTDDIGARLNKEHKPQTEWSLIALVGLIALIGGVLMYLSGKFSGANSSSIINYMAFNIIGVGILIALYAFNYTKLKKMALPALIFSLFLVTITYFHGITLNGNRFFIISKVAFSSECLLFFLLISLAGFIENYQRQGITGIIKLIIFSVFSVVSFIMMFNFGSAIIFLLLFAALMFAAVRKNHFGGNRRVQIITISSYCVISLALIIFSIISSPYIYSKQSISWLSMVNWFGKTDINGINAATPGIATDYVLINAFVTLGMAAGIILICTALLFIVRMFLTVRKVKGAYGYYLSLGAFTIIAAQYAISILLNFNMIPGMRMGMPFVSFGGTSYILNMALVGLLLSVWRRNNIISLESIKE